MVTNTSSFPKVKVLIWASANSKSGKATAFKLFLHISSANFPLEIDSSFSSLAKYMGKRITLSTPENDLVKPSKRAFVLEYKCGWKTIVIFSLPLDKVPSMLQHWL